MKKILVYYCIFFIGSVLPFIIVESYFQDYFTVILLVIFSIAALTISVSIKYLMVKLTAKQIYESEDLKYTDLLKNKEPSIGAAYFFFWKNLRL